MNHKARLASVLPALLALLPAPAASAQAPAVLLRDVRPGNLGSGILGFAEVQGRLFCSATTAAGQDLVVTDGTPAGTVAFNLPPAAQVYNGAPVAVGTQLFFLARTAAHGTELWRTDGTPAGTLRVTDLNPGATDAFADLLTSWRGYCFFQAVVPLGLNYGLWRSDGTTAGTARVGLWNANFRRLFVAGDKLFFVAIDNANGDELWVLDDPFGTPRLVKDIRPGPMGSSPDNMVEWRDKLWFSANDGVTGIELWTSDGTAAGTTLVADVNPSGSTHPSALVPTRDWLFFIPRDVSVTPYLMQTDGTAQNTQPVPHTPSLIGFPGPTAIAAVGNVVYARAATQVLSPTVDLWRFDGTPTGTTRVRGADQGRALSPMNLCAAGSRYVYFQGDDGAAGTELWRSDGTVAGTTRAADVVPGAGSSAPYQLRPIGGHLVFLATTPATGYEPFAAPLDAHGQAIGAACGAPARATTLTATDPVLGANCTLAGGSAFPGSTGFLFAGLPAAAFPLPIGGPTCRWLLAPAAMLPLGSAPVTGGAWTLVVPIPNDPSFQRVLLRAQGVFAPTDGTGGLDVTNPVNLHLGR